MNEMDKKKKIKLIVLFAILILLGIISTTVAFFGWTAEEESTINVTVIGGTGKCEFKSDNNIQIEPVASRESGRIVKFTAKQELANEAPVAWNMIVNEIGGLQHETFRYEMINTTTGVSYGSGNFANITNEEGSNTIHFSNVSEKLSYGTTYEFALYLWIDGTIGNNPLSMANQNLDFDMNCVMDGTAVQSATPLIEHIQNRYKIGNPTLITHNKDNGTSDTYYYSYQDVNKTWGLMNDGLKVADISDTGATTISDTSKLTTGTEGNIRYFGPSDKVNNYIYFNCDDYSDTSTCERWRIIGIVDGKVKIIKNDSIGTLAWDQDKNQDSSLTTYSNNWETSSLQLFLNGLYYDRGTKETHTYYSGETGETSTLLDLKTIGITKATKNNNLISESTWYLGGYNVNSVYPNDIYNYERKKEIGTTIYDSNPSKINANIGLIYISDYGFATNFEKCFRTMAAYASPENSYACRANNWIFNSKEQWIISPDSSSNKFSSFIVSAGTFTFNTFAYAPIFHVYPSLYLSTDVVISGGTGSYHNPYVIGVDNTPVESPLQLGDYVSYTPTVTSYDVDTSMTGYTGTAQSPINPSELNLWRVLNKNEDGSVEIISEYVSSTAVRFQGQTGYLNFVGYLNDLAEQYETEGITSSSRHFGFNGQTEYLEPSNVQFTNPPPFTGSTTDNSNESQGGGDTLYLEDYNKVKSVLDTVKANKVGTTTLTTYWMASRFHYYSSSQNRCYWEGRMVKASGSTDDNSLYSYKSSTSTSKSVSFALRPIVTLKPGLSYTGDGTSGSPWQIAS